MSTPTEKLERIERLAHRHNNPGVNVGAHRLAQQILAIICCDKIKPGIAYIAEPDFEDQAANLSAEGT